MSGSFSVASLGPKNNSEKEETQQWVVCDNESRLGSARLVTMTGEVTNRGSESNCNRSTHGRRRRHEQRSQAYNLAYALWQWILSRIWEKHTLSTIPKHSTALERTRATDTLCSAAAEECKTTQFRSSPRQTFFRTIVRCVLLIRCWLLVMRQVALVS